MGSFTVDNTTNVARVERDAFNLNGREIIPWKSSTPSTPMLLYRYAGAEDVEEDALADFTDAGKVSAYVVDAVNWSVSMGLINGTAEDTLAPRGNATRDQIGTILMRYCEG